MNRVWKMTVVGVLALASANFRVAAHVGAEEMAEEAKTFLDSLKPEQRDKAFFQLKSDERFDWNFVPKDRKGLPLKEMTKPQRDHVHALLDAALSHRGFVKATTIMSLETILHELENKSPKRDPELYYVSIFGEPKKSGTWAWRFEGHHLSLNFTIVDGEFISETPSFMGSNPGEVKDGPRKGLRVLAAEEDLGRALVQLLDDEQRKTAIISADAPKEIITKNDRRAKPLTPDGLAFAQMNREQGEALLKLIKEYIYRYREEIADDDWKKIKAAGLDKIFFAWAGGTEKGQPHYYRVQGPTFLLEYDNTQNNANHVHAVLRSFDGDFGEDILQKHYQQVPHDRPALNTDSVVKPANP